MYGLSVIFPVLNEKKNLEVLIPSFTKLLKNIFQLNFELIIVDDNSTDDTKDFIENLSKQNKNIIYFLREKNNSLPKSILKGIEMSKYDNIMWLDADCSMTADDAKILINEKINTSFNVIIGSRFVDGGGHKGTNSYSNFIDKVENIFFSEDSFLAIYLSNMFNKLLKIFSNSEINDLTSGFILLDKKCLVGTESIFNNAYYGEYFIDLLKVFDVKNYSIKEVGYYCKTRMHGESKTSNNYFRLLKLSKYYIKSGLKYKKKL